MIDVYSECDKIVDQAEAEFKKLPLTDEERIFINVKLYELRFSVIPGLRHKDRQKNEREMSVLGLKKEGEHEGKSI